MPQELVLAQPRILNLRKVKFRIKRAEKITAKTFLRYLICRVPRIKAVLDHGRTCFSTLGLLYDKKSSDQCVKMKLNSFVQSIKSMNFRPRMVVAVKRSMWKHFVLFLCRLLAFFYIFSVTGQSVAHA